MTIKRENGRWFLTHNGATHGFSSLDMVFWVIRHFKLEEGRVTKG